MTPSHREKVEMAIMLLIVLVLLLMLLFFNMESPANATVIYEQYSPLDKGYIEGRTVFCSASMKDKSVYQKKEK